MFHPFRTLGVISEDVQFSVQRRRGGNAYVTVSVGKAFQIYDCSNLRLVLVGEELEHKINALASWRDFTFAAFGKVGKIGVFHRAHRIDTWHHHIGRVSLLLILGDYLISVSEDRTLKVWEMDTENYRTPSSPRSSIELPSYFTTTCLIHPETYLNKILLGSEQGRLQLWNISTEKLIFEFKSEEEKSGPSSSALSLPPPPSFSPLLLPSSSALSPALSPAIRCLCSSPALDTVAYGRADGSVIVRNIRVDQEVMRFSVGSAKGAAVAATALSFKTEGPPWLLAVGDSTGVISVFDLEHKKLRALLPQAHAKAVTSLLFLPGENIMLSSGKDNAVKEWIFDSPDGSGRLLRFRSGHYEPPCFIKFYGSLGRLLLSAGTDRSLRLFSTVQDHQSREMSMRHVDRRAKKRRREGAGEEVGGGGFKDEELKLGPITAMDASEIRERDWSNVASCHLNDPYVYTWRLKDCVIGENVVRPPFPLSHSSSSPSVSSSALRRGLGVGDIAAKCVSISQCGNFLLVGYSSGHVACFYLQSGRFKKSFQWKRQQYATAHEKETEIICVDFDAINKTVVSVGNLDGKIKVWDFQSAKVKGSIPTSLLLSDAKFHRSNGLLVVSSNETFSILIFDVLTRRMVRKFEGLGERITAFELSENSKFLLAACMDGSLKIFDVMEGKKVSELNVVRGGNAARGGESAEEEGAKRAGEKKGEDGEQENKELLSDLKICSFFEDKGTKEELSLASTSPALSFSPLGTHNPIIGLSLSPQMDMLATIHAKERGIQLWANHLYFSSDALPDTHTDGWTNVLENTNEGGPESNFSACPSSGLVSLSLLPPSQMKAIMHLELIKERNKPIAPPKKPASAPFFLPTRPSSLSGNPEFEKAGAKGERVSKAVFSRNVEPVDADVSTNHIQPLKLTKGEKRRQRKERMRKAREGGGASEVDREGESEGYASSSVEDAAARMRHVSPFYQCLSECSEKSDYSPFLSLLTSLSPSALDLELRRVEVLDTALLEMPLLSLPLSSLSTPSSPPSPSALSLLLSFLEFFAWQMERKDAFELVQAVLYRFLMIHGTSISSHPALQSKAQVLSAKQEQVWNSLDSSFLSLKCALGMVVSGGRAMG